MKKRAFTLIELLTVIAIIAILAAIIFPVFNSARRHAKQTQSESNLEQIHTALKLYHADYNAYPLLLGGYVERYANNSVVPMNELTHSPLYKDRVDSINVFHSPLNLHTGLSDFVGAVLPSRAIKNASTGQYTGVQNSPAAGSPAMDPGGKAAQFYVYDSYDIGELADTGTFELHYMPFWTDEGLAGGGKDDDPRQLGYAQPDESSVVTWDTSFRTYDVVSNGTKTIRREKNDIVLFLNGTIKYVDSVNMSQHGQGQLPTDP